MLKNSSPDNRGIPDGIPPKIPATHAPGGPSPVENRQAMSKKPNDPNYAIPGYPYANAIVRRLIERYHHSPTDDDKAAIAAELADVGRLLLNIAAPLATVAGYSFDAFDALYLQCRELAAKHWRAEAHYPEPPKVELLLDVMYELQREVRELRKLYSSHFEAVQVFIKKPGKSSVRRQERRAA